MTDEIECTLLRDRRDLAPHLVRTSWTTLARMFREPRRSSCSTASREHQTCKEGPAWSPAVYPPGTPRQRSLVEKVSLLVVDLDYLTDEQFTAATTSLAPYQRILHASHSDQPSHRHVRAIVAISRPVTRDEWPRFWRAAMARLRQPTDPSCCDASRFYYLPSRPEDADAYFFEAKDGLSLDVDAILATAPPESPPNQKVA